MTFHVERREDGYWLIARPADDDFVGALAAAGITVPDAPEPSSAGGEAEEALGDDQIDAALRDYLNKFGEE